MFLAMLRLRVCDVEKNIHFKSAPGRKTLSPPQVIISDMWLVIMMYKKHHLMRVDIKRMNEK